MTLSAVGSHNYPKHLGSYPKHSGCFRVSNPNSGGGGAAPALQELALQELASRGWRNGFGRGRMEKVCQRVGGKGMANDWGKTVAEARNAKCADAHWSLILAMKVNERMYICV